MGQPLGADLCRVLPACKVIQVAAADAERLRPTPFLNGLENGAFMALGIRVGTFSWAWKSVEMPVCKASRDRVSLGSCSGAIRDCLLVVVVPGVSVV